MENTYVAVRFENNSSKWDGKEAEVPGRTVVRLGRRGEDGLEKAEVSWPGKGKTGRRRFGGAWYWKARRRRRDRRRV